MFSRWRKSAQIKTVRKICPYPFARMELNNTESFVPCCSDWLTEEYFKLTPGKNRWNGQAARALRESVLDGSYRYCRTDLCKFNAIDPLIEDRTRASEAVLTEKNRKAILAGRSKMPEGPTSFTVLNDARCNLACPSCRPDHIVKLSEQDEKNLNTADELLKKYRQSIEILKVAGDGEVFFSPWLKSVVKNFDPSTHPRMRRINILTNGLLFNKAMYEALMPGAAYIKSVSVSVDAGNEETYLRVRGGSWEKLLKNLHWVGEQKSKGVFQNFQMNFTVQAANFESIPDFIALARKVGANEIRLSALLPFRRMAINYEAHAVHRPEHPQYEEFKEIWTRFRGDEFIKWALPEPEISRPKDNSDQPIQYS